MAIADDVVALAPQFAGNASIDTMITIATPLVPYAAWGEQTALGVTWMTCHLLQIAANGSAGGGGAAGPITADKAGDVSRSYGSAGGGGWADAGLSETVYGRQFLQLRGSLAITGPRLAGPVCF